MYTRTKHRTTDNYYVFSMTLKSYVQNRRSVEGRHVQNNRFTQYDEIYQMTVTSENVILVLISSAKSDE